MVQSLEDGRHNIKVCSQALNFIEHVIRDFLGRVAVIRWVVGHTVINCSITHYVNY